VEFNCGNYPEIQSIKIYGGQIEDPEPFSLTAARDGEENYLFENITPDKFYNVTGLTPGAKYLYRVKAYYVNGTESSWSNIKEVQLLESSSLRGDVDGDGSVNVGDVTKLINMLLNNITEGVDMQAADCNYDGKVDIQDISTLLNYVLTSMWP
jgi:hypothetical protein